jgi:cysteine-rich repeat protein
VGCGAPEDACDDKADNDGDGALDCADEDCAANAACLVEVCDNNADDDGDTFVDCFDSNCALDPACNGCGDGINDFLGTELCDDGNTSDGDGCSALCTLEPGFACSIEPEDEPTSCQSLAAACGAVGVAAIGLGSTNLLLEQGSQVLNEATCPVGSPGLELIFSFTPAVGGTLRVTATPDGNNIADPVVFAKAGGCEDEATLACADEGIEGDEESISFAVVAGQSVEITVDSFNVPGEDATLVVTLVQE